MLSIVPERKPRFEALKNREWRPMGGRTFQSLLDSEPAKREIEASRERESERELGSSDLTGEMGVDEDDDIGDLPKLNQFI